MSTKKHKTLIASIGLHLNPCVKIKVNHTNISIKNEILILTLFSKFNHSNVFSCI